MRKRITTALVALGMMGLSACTKTDTAAGGNAADAGVEAGNVTDETGLAGNEATPIDGDSAAPGNALETVTNGNAADLGTGAELGGNAADAGGNAN